MVSEVNPFWCDAGANPRKRKRWEVGIPRTHEHRLQGVVHHLQAAAPAGAVQARPFPLPPPTPRQRRKEPVWKWMNVNY